MCEGKCACENITPTVEELPTEGYTAKKEVTVTVEILGRYDRNTFLEAVGPLCAMAGRDMFLELLAEYDRRHK